MITFTIISFQARNHSNVICVRASSAGSITFFIHHSLPLLKDFLRRLRFEFFQKMIGDFSLKQILPGLTTSPCTWKDTEASSEELCAIIWPMQDNKRPSQLSTNQKREPVGPKPVSTNQLLWKQPAC